MTDNEHVIRETAHPYGAIRWDDMAEGHDCITAVQAFDDLDDALGFATSSHDGEFWAVVDLRTMSVIARGSSLESVR